MVKKYIEDGASYRRISKRLREKLGVSIGRTTVCNMVHEAGRRCKTPVETAEDLMPVWKGWLVADGKSIKVAGEKRAGLIGMDSSRDLVDQQLAPAEDKLSLKRFYEEIKNQLKYPIRGVVTDMDEAQIWAVKKVFGDIPHQYCLVHMERLIDSKTNYRSIHMQVVRLVKELKDLQFRARRDYYYTEALVRKIEQTRQKVRAKLSQYRIERDLRRAARRFIYAGSRERAEKELKRILAQRRRYSKKNLKSLIGSLVIYKEGLLRHHDVSGLPRSTNIMENYIRNMNRRLKTMDGFQTDEGAEGFLNLHAVYYRFKPFTDCRKHNKHLNGKSPLNLARVNTTRIDWVRYSQRGYNRNR